jgi:hypothetical protein
LAASDLVTATFERTEFDSLLQQMQIAGWQVLSWGANAYDAEDYTVLREIGNERVYLTIFLDRSSDSGTEFAIELVNETADSSTSTRTILESGNANPLTHFGFARLLSRGTQAAIQSALARLVGSQFKLPDYYEIGREQLRQYARGIKNESLAHYQEDAAAALGYSGIVAPIAFIDTIGSAAIGKALPELILPPDRAEISFVQVACEIEIHRPAVVGDRVHTAVIIDGVRTIHGHMLINLRKEYTDIDGAALATVRNVIAGQAFEYELTIDLDDEERRAEDHNQS